MTNFLQRLLGARGAAALPGAPVQSADDTRALEQALQHTKPELAQGYRGYTQLSIPRYFPNPDEVLIQHGGPTEGLAFYRRIRRQVPFVSGLFKIRIDAAMSCPHQWVAGDPDDGQSRLVRDVTADAWANMPDRESACRKLMFCIADGVSFGETVWSAYEAKIVSTTTATSSTSGTTAPLKVTQTELILVPRIIDRRPENFYFDKEGNVWFHPLTTGELLMLDPLQYIVGRYGSAELWGYGEMPEAYADIWKMDVIDKMALRALEKQGYPMMRVLVPESWDADQVNAVRLSIAETYPNFVVIPFGDQYEESFPDANTSPTYLGKDQIDRQSSLRDTVSIDILGVAFSNTQVGSLARDQVRNELRFEKTPTDAMSLDQIATSWGSMLAEVNYPSVPVRARARHVTDAKPTSDLAQWMNALTAASRLGFEGSKKQLTEKQGLEPAKSPEDALKYIAPPGGTGIQPVPASGAITVMSESGEVFTFDSAEEFRAAMLSQGGAT